MQMLVGEDVRLYRQRAVEHLMNLIGENHDKKRTDRMVRNAEQYISDTFIPTKVVWVPYHRTQPNGPQVRVILMSYQDANMLYPYALCTHVGCSYGCLHASDAQWKWNEEMREAAKE